MTDNLYRKLTQDEIEYQRMESEFRYELQYNTDIERAREQGLAKGEAVGLKKGEALGLAKGEAVGLKKGEALGLAKGKAEGEALGLAKGKLEGKLEIASAMKAKGIDNETISELTGLSEEEIKRL